MAELSAVLQQARVRLEPLAEHHLEPLRAACTEDQEIWDIYPVNMLGDGFDQAMKHFHQQESWVQFAVIDTQTQTLAGMTNYINPDLFHPAPLGPNRLGVVEIGGTYIRPAARGTGINRIMKHLLIGHAFANGFHRIEFRVDTRNTRSMAAVQKLGAVHEGTLRKNRITWTGYVRDTAVFGLLKEDWAARPPD